MNTSVKKLPFNVHRRYKSQNESHVIQETPTISQNSHKFQKIEKSISNIYQTKNQLSSKRQKVLKENFQLKQCRLKFGSQVKKYDRVQKMQKQQLETELTVAHSQIKQIEKQYKHIHQKYSEQFLKKQILIFLNDSLATQNSQFFCFQSKLKVNKSQNKLYSTSSKNCKSTQQDIEIVKTNKSIQKTKHNKNLIENVNNKLITQILQLRKTRAQIQSLLKKLEKQIKTHELSYVQAMYNRIIIQKQIGRIRQTCEYNIGQTNLIKKQKDIVRKQKRKIQKNNIQKSLVFIQTSIHPKQSKKYLEYLQQLEIQPCEQSVNTQNGRIKFKKLINQNQNKNFPLDQIKLKSRKNIENQIKNKQINQQHLKLDNKITKAYEHLSVIHKIYSLLQIQNISRFFCQVNFNNQIKSIQMIKSEDKILSILLSERSIDQSRLNKAKTIQNSLKQKNDRLIQKIFFIQRNIQQIKNYKKLKSQQQYKSKAKVLQKIQEEDIKIQHNCQNKQNRAIKNQRKQLKDILILLGIDSQNNIYCGDSILKKIDKINFIQLEVSIDYDNRGSSMRFYPTKQQTIVSQSTDQCIPVKKYQPNHQSKKDCYQSKKDCQILTNLTNLTNFCKTVKFEQEKNKVQIGKQTLNNIYRNLKIHNQEQRVFSKDQFQVQYQTERKKRVKSACRRKGLIKSSQKLKQMQQSQRSNSIQQSQKSQNNEIQLQMNS